MKRRRNMVIILIIVASATLCNLSVYSDTITANSCLQPDVQSALDSASPGDRVYVPPGSCTWSNDVVVPIGVTLEGAGIGQTVITYTGSEFAIISDSDCRITGFTIKSGSASGMIHQQGSDWRVDHVKLDDIGSVDTAVHAYHRNRPGSPFPGVIDHCEIINCRILVEGNRGFSEMHKIWAEDSGLGTNNAVFIEDCTIVKNSGNAVDANRGGRYVVRYCDITDCYLETHSLQDYDERATRSWEIYENSIHEVNIAMWVPMFLRGGTGVAFNNTIDAGFTAGIALDNVRCFTDVGGDAGLADGTSPFDENTPGESGWLVRDQIGAGKDTSLWTDSNPYPPQTKEPAYFWNNVDTNGSDVVPYIHNNCGDWIQLNRDYFVGTSKPGYTPYTYPHPLTVSGDGVGVLPPEKLRIKE